MNKIHYIRSVACYLLALLLMLLVAGIQLGCTYLLTVENKDAILHSFAEMNYFEQAAQKAQEDFGDYIVQSGFEEDLFEDLATPQMVEQDLSAFIDGFYAYIRGEADEVDMEVPSPVLQQKLQERIDASIAAKGLEDSQALRDNITAFKRRILSTYASNVLPLISFDNLAAVIRSFHLKVPMVFGIGVGAAVLLLVGLFFVAGKRRFLPWLSRTLFASGFFVLIPTVFLITSHLVNKFFFSMDYFSIFAREFVQNALFLLLLLSIAVLTLGVLAAVGAGLVAKKGKKTEFGKEQVDN